MGHPSPGKFYQSPQRLHHTYLIIYCHDRDKTGIWTDRSRKLVQVNKSIGLDWEVSTLKTLLLKVAARVEHALVLNLGSYDMLFLVPVEPHDTLDEDVFALSGARSEEDLFWIGSNQRCNLSSSCLHHGLRFPAVEMGSRVGVSVTGEVEGEHGVEHTGVN
jgi:hypothetical protein